MGMQLVSATPAGLEKTMKDIVEECIYHGLTLEVGRYLSLTDLEEMGYVYIETIGFIQYYVWADTYPVYIQWQDGTCILYHEGGKLAPVEPEEEK